MSELYLADAHLQSGARGPDSEWGLEQVGRYAEVKEVEAVVSAGDLLDKAINRSGPVAALARFIERLRERDIKFIYVNGQHEGHAQAHEPSWPDIHQHSVHLHKRMQPVFSDGEVLYGLDWQPAGTLQEELNLIPQVASKATILICHQVWSDWMGSVACPQGDFADIPVVRTVVSGDLHKNLRQKAKGKDGQEMVVISPGALLMQKSDEPVEHFCMLREGKKWTRLPLYSRPVFRVGPLVTPEEVEQAIAQQIPDCLAQAEKYCEEHELPEAVRIPYAVIEYSYKIPDVERRVEKIFADKLVLFWKVIQPEPKKMARTEIKPQDAVSPVTMLPEVIDPKKRPKAYALAETLLTSTDRKAALAKWRADYLNEDKDGEKENEAESADQEKEGK